MLTSMVTLLAASVKYRAFAPMRWISLIPFSQPRSTAAWYSAGTAFGSSPGGSLAAWMAVSNFSICASLKPAAMTD